MPFPKDTAFPIAGSLSSWNTARKGVDKKIKTGVGDKLKAAQKDWTAIKFADLNPAPAPKSISEAQARLVKAQTAFKQVQKAQASLKLAQEKAAEQGANTKLNDTARHWLTTTGHAALITAAKTLADMHDLVAVFSDMHDDHMISELSPGGRLMQIAYVRREWAMHQLPKVDQKTASLVLGMRKDGDWLVRGDERKLILSYKRVGQIQHADLEKRIEALKSPKDLNLNVKQALTERDVAAAKLAAIHVAKLHEEGSVIDKMDNLEKAQQFKDQLKNHATPPPKTTGKVNRQDEMHELLQQAHARQAWEGLGPLKASTKDAEAALKVSKDGSWLVRKQGSKTMLSVHKGAQVHHESLDALVKNHKWPKDLGLDAKNRLDENGVATHKQASKHLDEAVEFKNKMDELRGLPGYFGDLDINGAAKELEDKPVGSWLVRASSQLGMAAWAHKVVGGKIIHDRITNLKEYKMFMDYTRSSGRLMQVRDE